MCLKNLVSKRVSYGAPQDPAADFWVTPVIQGFVQVEELVVNYSESPDEERSSPETPPQELTCVDDIYPRFTVALISRRSRHRAGTIEAAAAAAAAALFRSPRQSEQICNCLMEIIQP